MNGQFMVFALIPLYLFLSFIITIITTDCQPNAIHYLCVLLCRRITYIWKVLTKVENKYMRQPLYLNYAYCQAGGEFVWDMCVVVDSRCQTVNNFFHNRIFSDTTFPLISSSFLPTKQTLSISTM